MEIHIAAARSPSADTLVFMVAKDRPIVLPLAATATIAAGAGLARFAGEAASIFETFVEVEGETRRVILLGAGGAQEADVERAGAALVARLATSGAKEAAVSFAALDRSLAGRHRSNISSAPYRRPAPRAPDQFAANCASRRSAPSVARI